MLASTATASADGATQPSSPRANNSMLIAEISSNAWRTDTDTAAPWRTASAAAAGTYTERDRPPARGSTT